MAYEQEAKYLANEAALRVLFTEDPLTGDKTLKRRWDFGRPELQASALAYLNTILTVQDPIASSGTAPAVSKVYPGLWRVAHVDASGKAAGKDEVGPIQTLVFGYASQINWSEARLVDGDTQPLQPARSFQVRFPNLNYSKLGAMVAGLETTKYIVNPVIAGETYNGPPAGSPPAPTDQKWRVLNVKPSRAEDGSGVITIMLAKNLVTTPDTLSAPILLSDDLALLSPFALDVTSFKNSFVWEYRWIDPSYAQTLRNTVVLVAGVIDAKVIKADDGSCNIQVMTQTNTWNGDLSQVWEKRVQSPTFAAEGITETFSHIPLTSLAAFKTTLSTPTTGYKVSSLVDSTAEEGYARIVQTQDKLFPGTVTPNNGVRTDEDILLLMVTGVIRTTVWLGVKDADLDTAMTTLLTAPTGYTALRVGNNYSGTGSCNITRTMLTRGTIADKIQTAIEYPTFEGERITYHYPGLNLADANALYLSLQTAIVVGYKVDSVSIVESRMALTVVQQLSKVQVAPFTVSAVHAQSFTHTFGLVTRATTVYLNVPFAAIGTVKTAINAIPNIIVLDISDDDRGTGSANVTYTWRTLQAAPRALGAIRSIQPSQFHQTTQDRLWIDVNLTDKDALATAVALALAGTAPYTVAAGDTIHSAEGSDAGDKTGNINQSISKKPVAYTPALFSTEDTINPHGLQAAVAITDVKEYPEIAYADLGTIFTTLQTFLGTPPKGKIQVSLNGNGTFMMRGMKEETPTWGNTTPTYVKVGIQNLGGIGESKTELATGVPVASAAAIVAAGATDANYALDDIRMTERGAGEATIEKKQTLKSETALIMRDIPASGTQRAAQERIWPIVLAADFSTIWTAALTEGVTGNFILKYRQRQELSGGAFRVSNMVESTQVVVTSYTATYSDEAIVTVERGQDADAIPTVTDTVDVTMSVSGELNALNKYDYQKHTSTARVPKSCPSPVSWYNYGDLYTQNVYTFDAPTGKSWLHYVHHRQVVREHSIGFYLNATDAAAAATSGTVESSSISPAGGGLWVVHKTYRLDGDISVDTLTKPF
jgi:hypothetical protein